jgi:tetratricopeptide (TPR) repeat protein
MKSSVSVFPESKRRLVSVLLWVALFLGAVPWNARAADPADVREFNAAAKLFDDHHYGSADRAFGELIERHAESATRPRAVLYQARSRFNLGNHAGGLELLNRELPNAGAIADHYQFFIGEGLVASGRFREAAAAFEALRRDFPNPTFALDSYPRQAFALAEAGDWPAVSALLLDKDGGFLKAIESVPGVTPVVQGLLLAAEAEIQNGRPEAAIGLLEKIPSSGQRADFRWKKQFLETRAGLATGRYADPVATTAGLVQSAQEFRSVEATAEANLLFGNVLAGRGILVDAAAVWEGVLAMTNGPAEPRRQALGALIRTKVEAGDLAGAEERIRRFLGGAPNDPAGSAARLALAELRMREALALAPTNAAAAATVRQSALAELQAVTAKPGPPPLIGRAWLQIGWVHWLEDRYAEARTGFGRAVELLPPSEDATVAAFKTGDCELALGRPQAALDIYRAVEERIDRGTGQVPGLLGELEFQRLRAALNAGNLSEAEHAVTNLAASFATSDLTARATMLLGVGLSRGGRLEDARQLMEAFVAKNPASPYRDQAELVVARSFDRARQWTEAAAAYDRWIAAHTNSPLRPKVEYLRADSTYRSGNPAGALEFFSRLASERLETEESVLAENWLATYYWNGGVWREAQKHYQLLYARPNCPPELAFQARMMAGRAAFASSDYKAAREQFTALIESMPRTNPPVELAEAYFALGDTIAAQMRTTTNATAYGEAGTAFRWIRNNFAEAPIAASAAGRLGELHLEWAALLPDAAVLSEAERAFEQAIQAPRATPATVHRARIQLGRLREQQKRTDDALDLYLGVVYSPDASAVDPYHVQEAGLRAAALLETGAQWERAVKLYERLLSLVPAMRAPLARRLDEARIRLANARAA